MGEKKHIEFYGSATVGTKGQIVIPVKLRKELNIKAGDTLIFLARPGQGDFGVMKPEGMLALQSELEEIREQLSEKERR